MEDKFDTISGESSFNGQFVKKQIVEARGRKIEVRQAVPEHLTVNNPTIIAPGWGETHNTFRNFSEELFNNGVHVLMIDHQRFGGKVERTSDGPTETLRRGQAIGAAIEGGGYGHVNIIAHSQGVPDAVYTALDELHKTKKEGRESRIENVVLINPGGMIGNENFLGLVKRFTLDFLVVGSGKQMLTDPSSILPLTRSAVDATKYFVKNPQRATSEAYAVSQADLVEAINELHDGKIGVAIVAGVNDPVFPIERMINSGVNRDSLRIDGFYSTKGGHQDPFVVKPKPYAALASNALESLAEKKQKTQTKKALLTTLAYVKHPKTLPSLKK